MLSLEDLNTLIDYFDMIAFDRFMSYIHSISSIMATKAVEKPALSGLAEFDLLVSSIDKAYDVVKKIFASDTKTEIIKSITEVGFSSFEQSGTIQKIDDLQGDKYDVIVDMLSRTLGIPAE
jgi:hypothetical protein